MNTQTITKEDISKLFHINQVKAAEKLGLKLAKFKDLCREKFNIPRWPSRKILGYENEIENLLEELLTTNNEAAKPLLISRIVYLQETIEYIKKYPESISEGGKKNGRQVTKEEKKGLLEQISKFRLTENGFADWFRKEIQKLVPTPQKQENNTKESFQQHFQQRVANFHSFFKNTSHHVHQSVQNTFQHIKETNKHNMVQLSNRIERIQTNIQRRNEVTKDNIQHLLRQGSIHFQKIQKDIKDKNDAAKEIIQNAIDRFTITIPKKVVSSGVEKPKSKLRLSLQRKAAGPITRSSCERLSVSFILNPNQQLEFDQIKFEERKKKSNEKEENIMNEENCSEENCSDHMDIEKE